MSEPKRVVPHILMSSIAAAVLVGAWTANPFEGSAHEPERAATTAELAVRAPVAAAVVTTPATPAITDVGQERVEPAALSASAPSTEVAPLVEVPKMGRMSVWEARKQLKKRGLRFAFRDGSRRVRHEDYDLYRVRSQSLPAGDRVEEGTQVVVQVKEIRFASGY